jgi:hypothetical protein
MWVHAKEADVHYHHTVKPHQFEVLGTKKSGFKLWNFKIIQFFNAH